MSLPFIGKLLLIVARMTHSIHVLWKHQWVIKTVWFHPSDNSQATISFKSQTVSDHCSHSSQGVRRKLDLKFITITNKGKLTVKVESSIIYHLSWEHTWEVNFWCWSKMDVIYYNDECWSLQQNLLLQLTSKYRSEPTSTQSFAKLELHDLYL